MSYKVLSKVTWMIAICWMVLHSPRLMAQDAHFTQFYQTPSYTNPALLGTFNGSYRIGMNYRDQWRSALETPLSTFIIGGDFKFELGKERAGNDQIGVGIHFLGDRVDLFDYSTNGIALSAAYHKLLDAKTNQYLSLAFQGGVTTKTISYENLTFEDQFNAIDSYNLPTSEVLPPNNFGIGNFGAGLSYAITPSEGFSFNIGAAVYNLFSPNVSLFDRGEPENVNDIEPISLKERVSAHVSASISTGEFTAIDPRILLMSQGNHLEVTTAVPFKYEIKGSEGRRFYFGPGVRVAKNLEAITVESIIAVAGIEFKGVQFGLSYDHNVSSIISSRNGLSAIEFSVQYIGDYENADAFCPTF